MRRVTRFDFFLPPWPEYKKPEDKKEGPTKYDLQKQFEEEAEKGFRHKKSKLTKEEQKALETALKIIGRLLEDKI